MQAIARRFTALPAATRLGAALVDFVAHDRDRWVSVVCAGGFALLMWVDWLAA